MARLSLPPRLVDWTILAVVGLEAATGAASLLAGQPGDAWLVVLHGMGGLALLVLVAWKLRRVRHRLRPARWTRRVALSATLVLVALAAVGTGVAWVFGGDVAVLAWNLLNVHVALGLLLVPLVLVHLRSRVRRPTRAEFTSRRAAVGYLAVAAFGTGAWYAQRGANRLLRTPGADRRFTGSRAAAGAGNDFPATSWVADDPPPVDPDAWTLRVTGAVATPLELAAADLPTSGGTSDGSAGTGWPSDERAVLDCTSGWYADRRWRGVRVGDLLDRATPAESARWVRFTSVTGYRWSLPLAEAREALLATHVGGEPIAHGHGFPLRLVAPGRRGFQWVKWVESVEVRTDPDYGQWLAIFTSGFD